MATIPTNTPMQAKPTWRRRFRRAFLVLTVFYIVILMLFAYFQAALIFPGRATRGRADANVLPKADEQLVTLTTESNEKVVALFGRAIGPDGLYDDDSRRPTLLFCYGNGMCLSVSRDLMTSFRRLGVNVMIPEYVGYGMSTGHPSESGCYESAEAAYQWLVEQPDIDASRIIVGGWSLGAAVAAEIASRHETAGLMMLSPFTSMVDMGRRMYPILPVNKFLRHRFETLRKIADIHCPILIGHGTDDDLIPAAMSEALAKAAPGSVDIFMVPGARHNDFIAVGGRQIVDHFKRLIDTVMEKQPVSQAGS